MHYKMVSEFKLDSFRHLILALPIFSIKTKEPFKSRIEKFQLILIIFSLEPADEA